MIRALLARLFRCGRRHWHPGYTAAIALRIDNASPGGLL